MKSKIKYLPIVVLSGVIFLASCKNETKPVATNAVPADTTATQSMANQTQVNADSIAKAEAEAMAAAKADSIAKAKAEAEMASKSKTTPASKTTTTTKATKPTTAALPKKTPKPATPTAPAKNDNVKKRTGKDDVFVVSEIKPSYPGGDAAMMKFLKNNIKYPIKAKEEGIKGTVFVRFVVEKDGSVADVEVAKGVNPLLDAEAKRVVSAMPKWAAGKQNGTNVAVQYTLPVKFELIQ
ncbi:MAG: energy transducer TonB [Saprospiraceae bacterium]|nr:energy transducer TonB [Saprospiraceae bacterium]